jgi:hypothetical protein
MEIALTVFQLISGTGDSDSTYGFDDEIDDRLVRDTCVPPVDSELLHDVYGCGSLSLHLISVFSMGWQFIEQWPLVNLINGNGIQTGPAMEVYHLATVHVSNGCKKLENLLHKLNEGTSSQFVTKLSLVTAGVVVFSFFVMIGVFFLKRSIDHVVQGVLIALRRVGAFPLSLKQEAFRFHCKLDISFSLQKVGHDIEKVKK